jgi:excisionase family DNA binding protein
MKPQDVDVSPRRAAQMLKVSLHFIYQLLWANQLEGSRKIGKTWQIPTRAVEERLEKRAQ